MKKSDLKNKRKPDTPKYPDKDKATPERQPKLRKDMYVLEERLKPGLVDKIVDRFDKTEPHLKGAFTGKHGLRSWAVPKEGWCVVGYYKSKRAAQDALKHWRRKEDVRCIIQPGPLPKISMEYEFRIIEP